MGRRLRDWLGGVIRGDVGVAGLDGLRAVGSAAYGLQSDAEALRGKPAWDPWAQSTQTQVFLLSAWNAFALQTLADHVLAAEQRVEAGVLAFAQACVGAVPRWIEAARSAQVDPSFRPSAGLPADLPAWPRIVHPRDASVRALRTAYDALAPLPEYEVARLATAPPEVRRPAVVAMQVDVGEMHTAVEFADRLTAHARSGQQYAEVCAQLRLALDRAFTLGQVVAMPSLLERITLEEYRRAPSTSPPLAAVGRGWRVEDATGAPVGTVDRVEGEPALGIVEALLLDTGAFTADRRATIDQIASLGIGVVRLNVAAAQLGQAVGETP